MFQRWLETVDLSSVFAIACIIGTMLSTFVMQATWAESENREHSALRWFRRVSQFALAATLLWAVSYAVETSWQPWPPVMALVISIDALMLGRAISMWMRAPEALSSSSFASRTAKGGVFVFTIVAMVFFGMLLDRGLPYERSAGEMIPPEARAGEQIFVRWTGEKKRDCPGIVHRVFIDSAGTYHPVEFAGAVYARVGIGMPLLRPLTVPAKMACGPAQYIARTEFYCNPVQRLWPIVSNAPPVIFKVTC